MASREIEALLLNTKNACEREHRATIDVILQLQRLDATRGYADAGASSLFDYCTQHRGYSEGSAMRRISAARCLRKAPEVLEMLRERKVSLCTLSAIESRLTQENRQELLQLIAGKSRRQVEALLCERSPSSAKPMERVRPFAVAAKLAATATTLSFGAGASFPAFTATSSGLTKTFGNPPPPPAQLQIEKRFELVFSVNEALMGELNEAKALLWHKAGGSPSLEATLQELVSHFLNLKSPARRKARREARARRVSTATTIKPARATAEVSSAPSAIAVTGSRRVAAATRDAVLSVGRCQFVSPTGQRCTATAGLEVDHCLPVALGGGGDLSNLRCVCSAHNKLMAMEVFGRQSVIRTMERV